MDRAETRLLPTEECQEDDEVVLVEQAVSYTRTGRRPALIGLALASCLVLVGLSWRASPPEPIASSLPAARSALLRASEVSSTISHSAEEEPVAASADGVAAKQDKSETSAPTSATKENTKDEVVKGGETPASKPKLDKHHGNPVSEAAEKTEKSEKKENNEKTENEKNEKDNIKNDKNAKDEKDEKDEAKQNTKKEEANEDAGDKTQQKEKVHDVKEHAAAPHDEQKAPAEPRECVDALGVILAQDDGDNVQDLWPACSQKWSEDCRAAGCCADWDMKCYEKDKTWSACNTECKKKDDQNASWTCTELWPALPRTFDTCKKACKDNADCHLATYSSDGGGVCKMSKPISTRIVWAADQVNSTLCGFPKEKLKELEAKVNEQVPWEVPEEVIPNCSWSDEDCSHTKCCNDVHCSKDFSQCYGFSCYKKTDYYAGCRFHPPEVDGEKEWNGTWVGGSRELKTVGPAGGKVKLSGTSLFCFIVGTWDAPPAKPFWSPERELVDNLKNAGASIMQCDFHDFYDGAMTEVAEWGSFSNIDIYQEIWKEVKNRGDWAKADWTVKVDSDAVFFPERLKQHLDVLRVPFGAKVYIENNDYRFRFMGALEVVSKPAMELWLEKSHTCIRGKHEGGEDFFMRGCMDALGISHMIDHALLSDQYAGQDLHCTDGWAVAFHYYKSIIRWNWCYNEAVCGSRAPCDKGLEVEYVMDD